MSMWINKDHLNQARTAANRSRSLFNGYFWHWWLAMKEFFFLFSVCVGSLLHAFFPWFLDFKLLEWRIARLKHLKKQLPDDPQLKKVHFDD
jgi:hypothetical protein